MLQIGSLIFDLTDRI